MPSIRVVLLPNAFMVLEKVHVRLCRHYYTYMYIFIYSEALLFTVIVTTVWKKKKKREKKVS